MFAVVPPPRLANGAGNSGTTGNLETNNVLSNPTGLDLVVGEGVYVLHDDLLLATPPHHPTDTPAPVSNPLAPITRPPTTGTKISAVVIAPSIAEPAWPLRLGLGQAARHQIASIQEEPRTKRDGVAEYNGFGTASYYDALPSFGDGNPAFSQPVVAKGKKKEERAKPKTNMVKSNSSFVSRVLLSDSLTKRLAERSPAGVLAIANVNRALFFLDLSASNKTEHLSKVLFTKAHALCHHLNPITKTSSHLDMILGFNTSDIIWYEPMSQKYTRLNKNGAINPSPVIDIHWLPNKENLFLAAHADGTLAVYDKEKEDADFVSEEADRHFDNNATSGAGQQNGIDEQGRLRILKSVTSQNQKCNPVAAWKVNHSKVNKFAFSPDGQHLAIVSDDGTLTILDYINERILDIYRSFYGALLTVTWSPDGRYVLTGGQDDLVSIWSFAEQALIARCIGHESWVRDVRFDPWRCDDRNYRFGSVGEDCRLLLWDFSVGMLGRPKMSIRPRTSLTSSSQAQIRRESSARLRSNSNLTQQVDASDQQQSIVHEVDGKAATPILPPVINKRVGDHPLCSLAFQENCVLITDDHAHIKEWTRPREMIGNENGRV